MVEVADERGRTWGAVESHSERGRHVSRRVDTPFARW
jgi:hypothetical protein